MINPSRRLFWPALVSLLTAAPIQAETPATWEEHDGSRGVWVRSEKTQAFVALEPVFRVLAIAPAGEPSLLTDSTGSEQGLRLAFMDENQIPVSFDVGNQKAVLLERTPLRVKARLAPAAGLQYTVTIDAAADWPRLRLAYELQNLGTEARSAACWSVASFPRTGTAIIPFGFTNTERRRVVLPWWTAWPQPTVLFGREAMRAATTGPIAGGAMKVGVITAAGWGAWVQGRAAMVISSAFSAQGTYPEDGANLTFFDTGTAGKKARCELEQMSTRQRIGPGESAKQTETMEMITLPDPVPEAPDTLCQLIRAELAKRTPKP